MNINIKSFGHSESHRPLGPYQNLNCPEPSLFPCAPNHLSNFDGIFMRPAVYVTFNFSVLLI
jgi:hypothetical protein